MKTDTELKNDVKQKYAQIAKDSSSCCGGGCGFEDVSGVEYSFIGDEYRGKEGYVEEADLGLGCGLPTEFARIQPGNIVVDLGSGAGNDCFIARQQTGDNGRVIGLDFTQEMIDRARTNVAKRGFDNVEFVLGEIDNNPLGDNLADVVVSNCVFNLIPDRKRAFEETFRIIKPGGHFSISDVVVIGEIPDVLREQAELYAGCVSGAMDKQEYLQVIEDVGFRNVTLQKERAVTIPEDILQKYLSELELQAYREANIGIYSITVYAEKP